MSFYQCRESGIIFNFDRIFAIRPFANSSNGDVTVLVEYVEGSGILIENNPQPKHIPNVHMEYASCDIGIMEAFVKYKNEKVFCRKCEERNKFLLEAL